MFPVPETEVNRLYGIYKKKKGFYKKKKEDRRGAPFFAVVL